MGLFSKGNHISLHNNPFVYPPRRTFNQGVAPILQYHQATPANMVEEEEEVEEVEEEEVRADGETEAKTREVGSIPLSVVSTQQRLLGTS